MSEQEIQHIHCLDCDKQDSNPQVCATCKCVNTNKEEIFANADNSDYIHGETFETHFSHTEQNYISIIGTQKRWKGTVKITIEPVPCVGCGVTGEELELHKDIVGGDDWGYLCRTCLKKICIIRCKP